MHYPASVLMILILMGAARADDSNQSWEIRGRVVDVYGKPVEDCEVSTYWSSNGKQWNDAGEVFKVESKADRANFWKEEGVLAARSQNLAERLPDGQFTNLRINGPSRVSVVAIDGARQLGGLVVAERSASRKPVTITLLPLVRVTGKIYCPEIKGTPGWTVATVHPAGDSENCLHFTHCGSLKGEFSFLLPPGKYDLAVRSESPEASMPQLAAMTHQDSATVLLLYGGVRIEVPRGKGTLDLGVLNVAIRKNKDGVAGDYSRFYGKAPPALAITDARGIPQGTKLADFRGKWVLLYFWSLNCVPCTYRELPALARFYENHSADRGEFEILSICNAEAEGDKTFKAFDRLTEPFKDAWGGKPLPFPVLIDGDGKTFAAYGVHGVPNSLLIDPDGHLVETVDAKAMLAEQLDEKH